MCKETTKKMRKQFERIHMRGHFRRALTIADRTQKHGLTDAMHDIIYSFYRALNTTGNIHKKKQSPML